MALRELTVDFKHTKTYATEAALRKRIEQDRKMYPEYDDRFLVVRTPEGRWTAIVKLDTSQGGYLMRYEFVSF